MSDTDHLSDCSGDDDDDDVLPLDGKPRALDERHIKCGIYGEVYTSPLIVKFIDTPQFQRLRNIKQLGASSFVWPGATHTRFEHSLGVAHLCRELIYRLDEKQPDLDITQRDKDCVEIAGLCHDLGHGPFSHVWDGRFMPAAQAAKGIERSEEWTHEQGSELMLDALVNDPKNKIKLPKEDIDLIKDLIAGEPRLTKDKQPPEKAFLFDIVANKRNGLDVDKFDYLARDALALDGHPGQPKAMARRLIRSARVINDMICYRAKDAFTVFKLYRYRYDFHREFYTHKTARSYEHMLVDALLAAEPVLNLSERVFNKDSYLKLTDAILEEIEHSSDERLKKSQAIIERMRRRQHYKIVNNAWISREQGLDTTFRTRVTPGNIVEEAKTYVANLPEGKTGREREEHERARELAGKLVPRHVVVDLFPIHYGMKEKQPLELVYFYGKHSIDEALKAEKQDVSNLLPSETAEFGLRVYAREPQFLGLIQHGFCALLDKIKTEREATPAADPDADPDPAPALPLRPFRTVTPPLSRAGSSATVVVPATPPRAASSAAPAPKGSQFMKTPLVSGTSPKSRKRKRASDPAAVGGAASMSDLELTPASPKRAASDVGASPTPRKMRARS